MEQLERNRKLLRLKGVESEEATEDAVVPQQILEQFQKRRALSQDKNGVFDDLELNWNPDGTLNRMVAYKNGDVLYEMHFAWNLDGTLSKIMRL